MKKSFAIITLLILSLNLVLANNSGAIWTTNNDCGNVSQNVNQYARGEKVYINGNNFEPDNYEWYITGLNGGASCDPNTKVINGTYKINSSGTVARYSEKFCFEAYTVNLDDCGEYKVSFGEKKDNYRVDLDAPVVPEFGVIIGALTILSAVGVFFMVRRR